MMDNRKFAGLLRRANRLAVESQAVQGELTAAFRERYGTTYSDHDVDGLIEPLDYGGGSCPTVADADRLMADAGFPLGTEEQ